MNAANTILTKAILSFSLTMLGQSATVDRELPALCEKAHLLGFWVKDRPFSALISVESTHGGIHQVMRGSFFRDKAGRMMAKFNEASGTPRNDLFAVLIDPQSATIDVLNRTSRTDSRVTLQSRMMIGAGCCAQETMRRESSNLLLLLLSGNVQLATTISRLRGSVTSGSTVPKWKVQGKPVLEQTSKLTEENQPDASGVVLQSWFTFGVESTVKLVVTDLRGETTAIELIKSKLENPDESEFALPADYKVIEQDAVCSSNSGRE